MAKTTNLGVRSSNLFGRAIKLKYLAGPQTCGGQFGSAVTRSQFSNVTRSYAGKGTVRYAW
jgi:hypothetical protein